MMWNSFCILRGKGCKMKTTRIYDLPTRFFHWSFAAFFLGAFFIAKVFEDDSAAYPYHMMLGLLLGLSILLRILWGFAGSRYALFSSFALAPRKVLTYFLDLFKPGAARYAGHNPASSWAALIMMALGLGLVTTGLLMATGGDKDQIKEIHELFANAFILVVIAHVAGVILHSWRHRDPIALSMIDGKKRDLGATEGIRVSHVGTALVYLALILAFAFQLARNYDSSQKRLNLFGTSLSLGDEEHD